MKPEDFVHLRCRSTYSLLEALPSPEEIVLRAEELGHGAVGIADRNRVYGWIEFVQAAAKHGLKPILGIELDFAPGNAPFTLLAATNAGYRNLLALATAAALESSTTESCADTELLRKFGEGVIVLSGPVNGAIPQAAFAEDGGRVTQLTESLWKAVGKENVYFELMDLPHLPGQAETNQQLIHWGNKLGVPVVATCPSAYCRNEDREAHDVLLCIQRSALVTDPARTSLRLHDLSMRETAEMAKAFAHVPEAIANTRAIADRCTVSLETGSPHIPRFPLPPGQSEESALRRLSMEGFHKRFPQAIPAYCERLEQELQVITRMGFSGYFLIVADFIAEARRRGITVGPGRGSAAGSLVSYCLGITSLDPIAHGLIFERFLNPERITLPDIDTDFADNRRDEVLEYVRQKYGTDRVVQICTFGTLAARAAVKDVGRAYGIPFLEMNALAKLIPLRPGTKLRDALETSELKDAYESNDTYRRIVDAALKLEGKARHVSIHACGVVITPEPAVHYTALQRAPKEDAIIITQYAAKPLESLGLLKMDFLGLTNLTVIQTALEIIKRIRGENVDITTIPLDDPAAYALLQRGETTGVFQFESPGMRRYLKQLQPTQFQDIVAMAALFRPGPMEWIPSFIRRRRGEEEVRYLHPDLEGIFRETYGIGVYQEQILELARAFAGFSLGEADILRRAIGKKIKKELDAQREKFLAGAVRKGYKHDLAEKIFTDVILPFAGYGFPKAHAAGYARIAYETAYLKARYPAEFMAALLSSDAGDTDRVLIEIEECRAMGIAVFPPDINESLSHFTVVRPQQDKKGEGEDDHPWAIRFGLSAIKGIGESSVAQIIAERTARGPFTSLEDFARRVPAKLLHKKFIESLGKSGALDAFADRRVICEHYDRLVAYRKSAGEESDAQADLFGDTGQAIAETAIEFPMTPLATPVERLQWEKETLGLYVSSHPLAGLTAHIGKKAQFVAKLSTKDVGKKVLLVGLPESVKKLTTKKGEAMGILTLEDPTGKIEVTLFPRIFRDTAALLAQPDTVVVAGGTLDFRAGALQLKAEAIKRTSLSGMIARAKEEGTFDAREAQRPLMGLPRSAVRATEAVEALDEEGNIIAGETVVVQETDADGESMNVDFLGPLGTWISEGMDTIAPLRALGLVSSSTTSNLPSTTSSSVSRHTLAPRISIHTIRLPARAPRQLLIDLRQALETFPGSERVQLKIGEQAIPLAVTVRMSPILEKRIEDVLARYAARDPAAH